MEKTKWWNQLWFVVGNVGFQIYRRLVVAETIGADGSGG